jgi:error-prone DNA polymerase
LKSPLRRAFFRLNTSALESVLFKSPSGYAELHCLTSFSFQRGASHPEELVARAYSLGYSALAITDECSVAGVVRAHLEAKKLGLRLLLGAEFALPTLKPNAPNSQAFASCLPLEPGQSYKLVALAHNLNGWGNLCEFITTARRVADKGSYTVNWASSDFPQLRDCEILLIPYVSSRALSVQPSDMG